MVSPLDLWVYVQHTLETHGWKLLGAALLLHFGRQQFRAFKARRHHQQTLAAANDPARVAVLQRETARVRHKQQQMLSKTAGGVKLEKAA